MAAYPGIRDVARGGSRLQGHNRSKRVRGGPILEEFDSGIGGGPQNAHEQGADSGVDACGWLRFNEKDRWRAGHQVPIEVNGTPLVLPLLQRIPKDGLPVRDVLAFRSPESAYYLFPQSIQRKYDSYKKRIQELMLEWDFKHWGPTLKRIERLQRESNKFPDLALATCAHRYGAVPVLLVGEFNGWQVGLLPEDLADVNEKEPYSDEELWELLLSLETFLPRLFASTYEQIALWLESIFFDSDEEAVLSSCARVRELIVQSIRGKIDLIERARERGGDLRKKADAIKVGHRQTLELGKGVDSLAHLMVNYVYRYFSLHDRTDHYAKELENCSDSEDSMARDDLAILKRAGHILQRPSDAAVRSLLRSSASRAGWVKELCNVTGLLAETNSFASGKPVDRPWVFLTRHFGVVDADQFETNLREALSRRQIPAELISGRLLGRDLRVSILGRVWFSELHLIYVPRDFIKADGSRKALKREENWVIIETLYGRWIGTDQHFIVGSPTNAEAIAEFRQNVEEYTPAKEIPFLSDHGWAAFAATALNSLSDALFAQKYLKGDATRIDEFVRALTEVLEPASRRMIMMNFRAWKYWFDPETWSVAQALLILQKKHPRRHHFVNEVVRDISARQGEHRYAWVARFQDPRKLRGRIARALAHIGDSDVETGFYFIFGGEPYRMVTVRRFERSTAYRLKANDLFEQRCRALGIEPDDASWTEIEEELMRHRKA